MKETRNLNPNQAEIRAVGDGRSVEGYAIVFNSESRDLGGFKEVIKPGAEKGVLDKADVLALLNHDEARGLLARYTAGEGSLSLEADEKGVKYRFDAPNTTLGDELLEGIKRGDIRTSSFAFAVAPGGDEWRKQDDGTFLREINAFADIFDISPVFREAYPSTSVSVALRKLEEARKEEKPKESKPQEEKPKEEQPKEDPKPSYDELNEHYTELENQIKNL